MRYLFIYQCQIIVIKISEKQIKMDQIWDREIFIKI